MKAAPARIGDPALSRFGGLARQIAVPGGSLEIETAGAGPPILLIHGWTLDRRVWAPQVSALAARFRVITYDRRGCGRSTAPPDPQQEAADVLCVLDALGTPAAAIVGMSQGARIALQVATLDPGRVAALVLQGAPLPFPGRDAGEGVPMAAMRAAAQARDLGTLQKLWRAHPLMQLFGAQHIDLLDRIARDYDGRDLRVPRASIAIPPDAIRAIGAPTLLIVGEHESAERKRAAAGLAGLIDHAERVEIPRAGHLCNLCRPDAFSARLTTFLAPAQPGALPPPSQFFTQDIDHDRQY